MALSEGKIIRIKVDFETGKLSKGSICKKHKISRPTLRKHATENEWIYQRNFNEVSKIVEEKIIEKLIENDSDRGAVLTEQFIKDSNVYRQLVMRAAGEISIAIKEEEEKNPKNPKVPKEEYDRIFAGSKITKINLEALQITYTGIRKALGMDIEKEQGTSEGTKIDFNFSIVNDDNSDE